MTRRLLISTSFVLVWCALFVSRASTSPGRVALQGSAPPWARSANLVSQTPANQEVIFRVYLPWRNATAAADYALSVSTKKGPNAGKFLTPQEFRDRFGPAPQDLSAVTGWLKGQGFSIGYTPGNRHYVEVQGTVAQAAAAFGTSFNQYRVAGKTLRAPKANLTVPADLPEIAGVIGLDDSAELVHVNAAAAPPPDAFVNAPPCSTYWGEKTVQNTATPDGTNLPLSPSAWAPCGYLPAQLQGAYGMADAIASGNDGSGVTVAVIDAFASPTIVEDIETYSQLHGLPGLKGKFKQVVAPGTFRRPQNSQQDPQGWSGEETLDIEAVHTMAPGASIVYVGAPNNRRDLDAVLNHVVDRRLADIVTNSYGYPGEALPPGFIKPTNDTLIQAAIEGMSFVFSSGDNGDETNGDADATPTPDWPASSPWVTAVGGTSLGIDSANQIQFELGWETYRAELDGAMWGTYSWLYGSGGGTSRIFRQPAYQAGVVPDAIARTYGGPAMRAVPDVALIGDPNTGMRIGQTQTFPDGATRYSEYRVAGTSLSSPLFAGMLALARQRHGAPFGLANPAIYAAGAAAYRDVTKADLATYPGTVRNDFINSVDATGGYRYTARSFDQDSALTIHVRVGYDDVTGLGSPRGEAWLTAMQ